MINASDNYKNALNKTIREPTQIKITHFMLDDVTLNYLDGYSETTIPILYYSDTGFIDSVAYRVFNNYAYLTNDTMRMDGVQKVLKAGHTGIAQTNGFIPDAYSDNVFSTELNGYDYGNGGITIDFGVSSDAFAFTKSGFFIEFDKITGVYATKIGVKLVGESNVVLYDEILENNSLLFDFKMDYDNVVRIYLTFYALNKPQKYMRVTWFNFGIVKTFLNEDLMQDAFTFEKSTSILSSETSYANLKFNVKNYPIIYDGDTTLGDYENYQTLQPIRFELGQILEDQSTEWIQVALLYSYDKIKLKDNYFTIVARDAISIFTYLSDSMYRLTTSGSWNGVFANCYFLSAGYNNLFYLWLLIGVETPERFSDYVNNPPIYFNLKILPYEAFQLIANYNNSALFFGSDGNIIFKDTLLPNVMIDDNGEVLYSNVDELFYENETPDKLYANLQKNFMSLVGNNLIIPPESKEDLSQTYFQSSIISNENGLFTENPIIEIIYSIEKDIYLMELWFDLIRNQYAIEFSVTYYDKDDGVLDEIDFTDNNQNIVKSEISLYGVKRIVIEITKWSEPYKSPIIMKLTNDIIGDYYLTENNMYSYPTKEMIDTPSSIEHYYYDYPLEDNWEDLGVIDGYVLTTQVRAELYTFDYYGDFYYEVESGTAGTITEIKFANKYLLVSTDTSLPISFRIYGKKRIQKQFSASKSYNLSSTVNYTYDNPFVYNKEKALQQIDWYYNFISNNYRVNIKYRGDPTIDVADYIYIDTKSKKRIPIIVEKIKLQYNGGLKGEIEGIKL